MRLEGKVALITGAAHGMGAEEARLFAREGAKVVIADIREDDARKVEAEISEAGGESMVIMLDVSQEDQWQTSVAAIVARFGRLDILVNNAGISGSGERDSGSTEAWDRLMDINAKSVFLGMKHAIPEMEKNGGGAIVNISSISGFVGQEAIHPGYNASKGAVRLFTKYTAVQFAKEGIRANSIHPGALDTDLIADVLGTPEGRAASVSKVPLGRIGNAEDVANAALFLASDDSSFVTGSELIVDGGLTAR